MRTGGCNYDELQISAFISSLRLLVSKSPGRRSSRPATLALCEWHLTVTDADEAFASNIREPDIVLAVALFPSPVRPTRTALYSERGVTLDSCAARCSPETIEHYKCLNSILILGSLK